MMQHIHQYATGHYFHVHGINSWEFARTGAVILPPEIATADNLHFHPAFQALETMLARQDGMRMWEAPGRLPDTDA